MKHQCAALLICFLSINSLWAQTISGLLTNTTVNYIQIVGQVKPHGAMVSLVLNFGNKGERPIGGQFLLNNNNNSVTISTIVDALDYVSSFGYEVVQGYAYIIPNGDTVTVYLMKKIR